MVSRADAGEACLDDLYRAATAMVTTGVQFRGTILCCELAHVCSLFWPHP
jgi:hypothetical protein